MLQRVRGQMLILNDQGFSLIELLVAVVILMVGMLGLLQGVNIAIMENLKNEFRNQAVGIAEAKLTQEKSKPFDNISTVTQNSFTTARIRSSSKRYTIVKQVAATGTNTKNIQIGISWIHKGVTYEQAISTLISNPNAN